MRYADQFELWRQGNYHWYRQLRNEIVGESRENAYIWWDEIESAKLWLLNGGELTAFQVDQFINHHGPGVIVSNGGQLNYTNYAQAFIPPPMCQRPITTEGKGVCCAGSNGFTFAVDGDSV